MTVMALVATTALATSAWAQEPPAQEVTGRFVVLVPDLEPLTGAHRGFGKDVAKELRTRLNTLLTHRALDRDAMEDALDAVDQDMKDLNCVTTRQLAAMMDAEVALCASYEEVSDGHFSVSAEFWDVRSGESFTVGTVEGDDGDEEEVAERIFGQFDRYTTHLRAAANCEGYAQSQFWDLALENCDEALRLNPDAIGTRYRRARVLFELGRAEDALQALERVLSAEPMHEAALQLAGYVCTTLGRRDNAHAYYTLYLELNPGSAAVRMRVAYEVAQAGDPQGARVLILEGLDRDPENIDLWEQLGGYAYSIAETMYRARSAADTGALAPDVVGYYREAIDAYGRVFTAREAATPGQFRSLALAHLRLGEGGDGVAWAEQGIHVHAEDASLWSVYADALWQTDRLDEALLALDRVEVLQANYPNLGLRQGRWLLDAARVSEAVAALRRVSEAEPDRADMAARLVLSNAHTQGVQQERYDYAIAALEAAREIPGVSQGTMHELDFWLGYSILRGASVEQEPRTLATAQATLPKFRRVLALLQNVGDYPASVRVDINELRANVQTYIEIQDAIIRRGG
jgi:predicted Zn-dependent protease